MKSLPAVFLAAALTCCVPAWAQNVPTTYPLGENGEITHWLALGYVPLALEQNAFDVDLTTPAKVLDVDLLTAVGGESKVQPIGGQKAKIEQSSAVKAPGEFAWRLARTRPPRMLGVWWKTQGLPMFWGEKGEVFEKSACYLYCRLVSPADTTAHFMIGSDDSVRVMLNGKAVHRFVGQRSPVENDEDVALILRKGANELLVRVDNYVGQGGFYGRLMDEHGYPLSSLKVELVVPAGTVELPSEPPPRPWKETASKIPPLPPAEHQEFFGARLARTMSLLQTSAQTHRPVRILIYGQSIEVCNWPDMLIQQLREQFPGAEILGDNEAIGGWNVGSLLRVMEHDIVRAKPDLVIFHAYQGTAEQWERFIQKIRRETTAEIMIRTSHLDPDPTRNLTAPIETDEVRMLRALAQKHDIELVDLRREWMDYLKKNNLEVKDMLRDHIHLNEKGCILMSQLYARHFRDNTLAHSNWVSSVRTCNVLRPLEDHKYDEIVLEGKGWRNVYHGAEAVGAGNALKLKFAGNRVDLVLMPGNGSAKVLIDGKAPSQLGLLHPDRPLPKWHNTTYPMVPQRYHVGPNVQVERWELTFTEFVRPGLSKFRLRGSVTGEDGEGDTITPFTSKSGRIIFDVNDWRHIPDYKEPAPRQPRPTLILQIVKDYLDEVACLPDPGGHAKEDIPYQYVTVANGLKPGEHELTLIPSETGTFAIQSVEIHTPPLMRK